MCGVIGLCNRNGEPVASNLLNRMTDALAHRGPDSRGVYLDGSVGLGHRRLAIIDLSPQGHQPMGNETGDVVVSYNGEIYNFQNLRADLLACGHRFRSHTDTEVIVHAYEEWGEACVERFNGMFAFAIWDQRRRRLFLARDRFGVKPLYWRWDGEVVAFASEVKALVAAGRARGRLSPDALVELLTFQNIASNQSLFEGVSMLPAGTYLTVDEHGPRVTAYWEPLPRPDADIDERAAVAGVEERFEAAVQHQLVADVELASYLSGGLDTGAISAVAAARLPRLTTFATGFDVRGAEGREAEFDERRNASELAKLLGTHHHELLLDSTDMEMVLARLVLHVEEPRMSFSYPNYLTHGLASRWVKVALSGAGGDEIFGGYPWRYAIADEADWRERYWRYWNRLLDRDALASALQPSLAAHVDLERPRRSFDAILDQTDGLPALDRILHYEFKTFLHGLLVVEDKLSMAHSLEARVPFLDNELVQYSLTIPARLKLSGARSKDLFRKAMARHLPENVLDRKKTGFTPPQAAWFRDAQGNYVESVLLSDRARQRQLFRDGFVKRLLDEHRGKVADHRLLLWTLLCLEWWQRIFEDGEHAS
jgi:asparagine synthase (glutamine-hydrolysing)